MQCIFSRMRTYPSLCREVSRKNARRSGAQSGIFLGFPALAPAEILPANAVGGKSSVPDAFRDRLFRYICPSARQDHTIETPLKFAVGSGRSCASSAPDLRQNRPGRESGFPFLRDPLRRQLFDMHWRNVDHAGAKTPARREPRDDRFGNGRWCGDGIGAGESRQETRPGARAEPAVQVRCVQLVGGQIECPLLIRVFPDDRAMPDRTECLRGGQSYGSLQRRRFDVGEYQTLWLVDVRGTQIQVRKSWPKPQDNPGAEGQGGQRYRQ